MDLVRRILAAPELPEVVPQLGPATVGRLLKRVGLEDSATDDTFVAERLSTMPEDLLALAIRHVALPGARCGRAGPNGRDPIPR